MRIVQSILSIGCVVLLLSACNTDDDTTTSTPEEVTYEVTFSGTWSASSHPTDYPSNSHFSPAIGMTHKEGASIFKTGELSTEGIKVMAEKGATSPLVSEIDNLKENSDLIANHFIGGGLTTGTSTTTFEIDVNKDFPLVTVVSMLAPSPDWFIAAENIALYSNNGFVDSLTVETTAYDAGTDSGTNFTAANSITSPPATITKITTSPLGNGTTVSPSVARFTFKRKQQ